MTTIQKKTLAYLRNAIDSHNTHFSIHTGEGNGEFESKMMLYAMISMAHSLGLIDTKRKEELNNSYLKKCKYP